MPARNTHHRKSAHTSNKITVTTSWDDGHKLDIRIAALLSKYGLLGTFYISPENRELPEDARLSPAEIRALAAKHEIGAHTLTHVRLTKVTGAQAEEEILESKQQLENITGSPITSFCYPYGDLNDKAMAIVRKLGFTYARSTRRFRFSQGSRLDASTTVHAYNHLSDAWRILRFAHFNPAKAWKLRDWGELAIAQFDTCSKIGGEFHLWGHSWEIDANDDWDRLEKVLAHISQSQNTKHVSNSGLRPSLKLLIAAPYYWPAVGGLERYAREMALAGVRDGAEVVVITTGPSRLVQLIDGCKIYRLPFNFRISNTPVGLRWPSQIRQIIKDEAPDIINVHTPVPFISDITTMSAGSIPVVVTYHSGSMKKRNLYLDRLIDIYEMLFLPFMLNKAEHIVCSSDWVRDNFLKSHKAKSSTITPGVDLAIFTRRKKTRKARRVLFIGNYQNNWKGLHILREAIKLVPNSELVVVGAGRQVPWERTTYLGVLEGSELVDRIHSSNVVVLPSITESESFGMVLAEAQACGVPVIGSNVGGIPQVIANDITGLLVAPRDPKQLADAISRILDDPELATKLGDAGFYNAFARFQWSDQTSIFLKLISEITDSSYGLALQSDIESEVIA